MSAASWASEGLLASGSIADDPGPSQSLRPAEGHGSSDQRSVDTAPSTRKRVERAPLPRYGLTGDALRSVRSRSPGRLGARSRPALAAGARPPFVGPLGSDLFEFSSLSIRLSGDRSATLFLNSAFSRSSSFKGLASKTCMAPNCGSHLAEHLLRKIVQPAHLMEIPGLLCLVQDPNDLPFRESFPLHLVSNQPKRPDQRLDSI